MLAPVPPPWVGHCTSSSIQMGVHCFGEGEGEWVRGERGGAWLME